MAGPGIAWTTGPAGCTAGSNWESRGVAEFFCGVTDCTFATLRRIILTFCRNKHIVVNCDHT